MNYESTKLLYVGTSLTWIFRDLQIIIYWNDINGYKIWKCDNFLCHMAFHTYNTNFIVKRKHVWRWLKKYQHFFTARCRSKLDCYQFAAMKLMSSCAETLLKVTLDLVHQVLSDCEHGCTAVNLHQQRTRAVVNFYKWRVRKRLKFTGV
jgi:hypothetical protein